MDPERERIREIGRLDIFLLLWGKRLSLLFSLSLFFHRSLLYVSCISHSSFLPYLYTSLCLSSPWEVCFSSLFTSVSLLFTTALSQLFLSTSPFLLLRVYLLLEGTNVLLEEFLSILEYLL